MTRFSRIVSILALVLASAAPVVTPALSSASAPSADAVPPLVVIRFNQPDVYYALQLHDAISKAVAIKPGVMIDVVSLAPATGNAASDKQWKSTAGRNTRAVIAAMKEMGVPAERISVRGETRAGIPTDETQIYVR